MCVWGLGTSLQPSDIMRQPRENMIRAQFLNLLRAEKLDGTWRLVRALRYQSSVAGARIIVPEGFVTDFASVPRLPLIYLLAGNTAHSAAVVHDYLYQYHLPGIDRSQADAVFYEAMRASGESRWRAWTMWSAVRMFGGSLWDSGPNRLKILGG